MNISEIYTLKRLANSATSIYFCGNSLANLSYYRHKFNLNLSSCDLIILNTTITEKITQIIKKINHSCTIFIPIANSQINKIIDDWCNINYKNVERTTKKTNEGSITIKCTYDSTPYKTRYDPISIFLVLKNGPKTCFDYRYVNATATSIRNNITHPHEIVCITDDSKNINSVDRIVKFENNFPKWWGKIELFRSNITKNQHCLFLDLDTVCLNSIDFLCNIDVNFLGLRDFYHLDVFQTGILKWTVSEETENIYNTFLKEDFSKYKDKGDHEWIGSQPIDKHFIQDYFPNKVCSFKKHMGLLYKKVLTPNILCFHGEPRPHIKKNDILIKDHWRYE